LRHFQATHQLLAFAIDEYGNIIRIVTLGNILEDWQMKMDDARTKFGTVCLKSK
jgi:Mg2+/Co2+ transporter CorB